MKAITKILAVALVGGMLCGCQANVDPTEAPTNAPTEAPTEVATEAPTEAPYPEDVMTERYLRNPDVTEVFKTIPIASLSGVKEDGSYFYLPPINECSVLQGACTDGTYIYMILEGSNVSINGVVEKKGHYVAKVDMSTWEVVAQSEPMPLDHGNSMCYNSKINRLIVAHCNDVNTSDNQDNTKLISFIDPDTLEIVDSKLLNFAINAIEYSPDYNLYVVGIKGSSAAFAVLDENFIELGYYEGHGLGLSPQDVDCDANYIYVGNSGSATDYVGTEVVKVYDWDGEYKGIFKVASASEHEATFNYGGKYYIGFYVNGGRIYEIHYDFSLLED